MDELPAGAAAFALARIAGYAVAVALETAKLLDVGVDHVARALVLVSAHGPAGSTSFSRDSPARVSTRLTVAGDTATTLAMCLPVKRWRRSASVGHVGTAKLLVALSTHRLTIFAVTANFKAAWAWERAPSITDNAISSRRNGVRRAFLRPQSVTDD